MKQWQKYLASLSPAVQQRIAYILTLIIDQQRSTLDIKPLIGSKNTFRCRVGTLRIIFTIQEDVVMVKYIGPRGDIYK